MADSYALSYDGSQPNMVPYPLYLQATGADPAITYTAGSFRSLIDAVWPKAGTLLPTDMVVTQRAAGANFSVDISAGRCAIAGTDIANQGKFLVQATGTVNIATPTAPTSGAPRQHRLVAQALDKQAAGALYGWQYHLVTDTGSGLPAAPADSYTLAVITIAVGAASVLNANIVNTNLPVGPYRPYFASAASTTATWVVAAGANALPGSDWVATDDSDHLWTVGAGTTSGFFTIPVYGRWQIINRQIWDQGSSSGQYVMNKIYKNMPGGTTSDSYCVAGFALPCNLSGFSTVLPMSEVMTLNAGDTIRIGGYSNVSIYAYNARVPFGSSYQAIRYLGPQ